MNNDYRLNWLMPEDARQVAKLEARVYPDSYRTGQQELRARLVAAEAAGENLSLGLFRGKSLVGYCLLFAETDRRKICSYLEISVPPDLELNGPGLFLADLAVHPAHRSQAWTLVSRLAQVLESRDDLRNLPMEAFSTPEFLRFWRSRQRVLAGLGFTLARSVQFQDSDIPFPLHWLQFTQCRYSPQASGQRTDLPQMDDVVTVGAAQGGLRIGVVRTNNGWKALEQAWDRLWTETPGATVFLSFHYLRAWWAQLGLTSEPFLVVVQSAENGQVRAIAPMQILRNAPPSPHRRCLSFMGQPSEVDRPTLLTQGQDPECAKMIADYLMRSHHREWDSMILYEQQPDSLLLPLMRERLRQAGMLVETPPGPDCPAVDVSGSWENYLASRSRSQRKSLKRHVAKIRGAGMVNLDTVYQLSDQQQGLQRYLDVERRSWKAGSKVSVARSSAHLGFLQALMSQQVDGDAPQLHFRFLQINDEDVAATLGLYWRNCLYALHITHDSAYDVLSPGFVLTALELEDSFRREDYHRLDYLGGFLSNKRGWAMTSSPTRALFAQPPTLHGYRYHLYHFHCKPWVKQQLAKMQLLEPVLRWRKALGRREGGFA